MKYIKYYEIHYTHAYAPLNNWTNVWCSVPSVSGCRANNPTCNNICIPLWSFIIPEYLLKLTSSTSLVLSWPSIQANEILCWEQNMHNLIGRISCNTTPVLYPGPRLYQVIHHCQNAATSNVGGGAGSLHNTTTRGNSHLTVCGRSSESSAVASATITHWQAHELIRIHSRWDTVGQ